MCEGISSKQKLPVEDDSSALLLFADLLTPMVESNRRCSFRNYVTKERGNLTRNINFVYFVFLPLPLKDLVFDKKTLKV